MIVIASGPQARVAIPPLDCFGRDRPRNDSERVPARDD
jgi:hypothetical protein